MQFFTVVPGYLVWTTPEWVHTGEMPFCSDPDCRCHHEPERVERYLVGPVARGEISGRAGLDRYYCRQFIGTGGRK